MRYPIRGLTIAQRKVGLLEDLRSAAGNLQTHYAKATDPWQAAELHFARNVVQDAIAFLNRGKV